MPKYMVLLQAIVGFLIEKRDNIKLSEDTRQKMAVLLSCERRHKSLNHGKSF